METYTWMISSSFSPLPPCYFSPTPFPSLFQTALWTLKVKIKAGDAGPCNKNIGVAVNSEDVLLLFVRAAGIRRMRISFSEINISASSRESIKIKTQEITNVKYGSYVKERGEKVLHFLSGDNGNHFSVSN